MLRDQPRRPGTCAAVTNHAIDRWRERVDGGASPLGSRLAIEQILALGRWRSTPRHWMRDARSGDGVRFVYLAARPHVCVVVRDGAAVTVLTRASSGRITRCSVREGRRPNLELRRWRWDGELDVLEAA